VFAAQESLQTLSAVEFAKRAGIRDTAAFAICSRDTTAVPLIQSDIVAARLAGGRGTPTILVNELRLEFMPDSDGREKLIKRVRPQIR